ncbi:MAG: YqeG family HAD IIIA-type phosphatase [Oscillospiraceae bacterium]|nr:YqeG family HAD IIIA-type phosphatase [Oscillospiraceae bacterium]
MLFLPDCSFDTVEQLTPAVLKKLGVGALVLDTDNTLTFDGSQVLSPSVAAWLQALAENGIPAMIVSNNGDARVRPFAEKCGLPYIAKAKKPLRDTLGTVCAVLGAPSVAIAVVGDQLFTDIAYAHACGMKALRVEPLGPDVPPFVKFKRILERPFMRAVRKRRWRDE